MRRAGDPMGTAIIFLIDSLIGLAELVIIVGAILSWLIAFDVINTRNPNVRRLSLTLERLTDPMLRPIRRLLPSLGGIDVSPIILLLLLQALKLVIDINVAPPLRALLG